VDLLDQRRAGPRHPLAADKYFKPAYVGAYGWIGAWLDQNPPWGEIEELLRDAWRRRAPKKVIPLLDGDGAKPAKAPRPKRAR
jgi:hypothetical protein